MNSERCAHASPAGDPAVVPVQSATMALRMSVPAPCPSFGMVRLRDFRDSDVDMLRDLSTDPYVPTVTSLSADAGPKEALAFIERQGRHRDTGRGFSFCVADARTDAACGHAGLWLRDIEQGRATAGYCIAPRSRGRRMAADALAALTGFAWTIPEVHRVELYIEPWNVASVKTAESAGYAHEGLLRSHQLIGGERVDLHLYAALRPPGPARAGVQPCRRA